MLFMQLSFFSNTKTKKKLNQTQSSIIFQYSAYRLDTKLIYGQGTKHSLADSAQRLSFSLRRSAFSPSILARSCCICLSSTLMALICGVTSGWSPVLASSAFRSSMFRLVLPIRFCWSSASVCLSFRDCLISSICRRRKKMKTYSCKLEVHFLIKDQKHS